MQDGVRGALPLYHGVSDAMSSMVRQEGWRSLYAGLTPALVGAGKFMPRKSFDMYGLVLQHHFGLRPLQVGLVPALLEAGLP